MIGSLRPSSAPYLAATKPSPALVMRVMKGSPVKTTSTPPDLMMSAMVGNDTSTKLTLLGSTPFSTSHFTNSTCRKAPSPGAPTFLPTKSFGSLMHVLFVKWLVEKGVD